VLELDDEQMSATLVREYTHPDEQLADAAANVQVLPNGNVFVGWGRALAFSGNSAKMASYSSTPSYLPKTGPTGPSASRGARSQAIGLLLWGSVPLRRRSEFTPAGTVPRR